uniref:protein HGV2-like n=1 Tax=Ciona intestinalis TaxID=7719 RepID=UPI0002B8E7C3|nr:protein HGV2-like [Ciona intestinalis]|eukprot:XP_026690318.1 protein HGV2-like [Ciona intestinalis]
MVVDASKVTEKEATQTETSEQDLENEYAINLANGKKNLLCGDFPEAVACFQATSALQSERFGETSHECAESFYFYGKALLELARVENGVLGNALKGVPQVEEASSESEGEGNQFEKTKNLPVEKRKELREEVVAAMATENEDEDTQDESEKDDKDEKKEKDENQEKKDENKEKKDENKEKKDENKEKKHENQEKKDENEKEEMECSEDKPTTEVPDAKQKESKDDSTKKSEDTKKEEKPADTSDVPMEADEPSTSGGVKDEDVKDEDTEDPDDVPNMQLAWEMLELAKVLYQKKPKSEDNSLLVAQCHSKLGELGLEVENYSQSIGDFLESLVIHKELLAKHDRRLAETHYNLGLAYTFDKRYDNALEHYTASLNVLDARMEYLNERIDENDRKKENQSETLAECAEIGEIKDLLPDINSKIEDVIIMKRQEGRLDGSPFRTPSSAGAGGIGSKRYCC